MKLKIVLRLTIEDDSGKRKALKAVAVVQGVDSFAVDMKEKRITVIGDVDPVYLTILTSNLRRFGFTELVSVGPAKEEKNKARKRRKTKQKLKK